MLAVMSRSPVIHRLAALAVCAAALGACGVKSAPRHPDGSSYPGTYPAAEETAPALRGRTRPRDDARDPAPAPASGIYQYPNPPAYRPPEN